MLLFYRTYEPAGKSYLQTSADSDFTILMNLPTLLLYFTANY